MVSTPAEPALAAMYSFFSSDLDSNQASGRMNSCFFVHVVAISTWVSFGSSSVGGLAPSKGLPPASMTFQQDSHNFFTLISSTTLSIFTPPDFAILMMSSLMPFSSAAMSANVSSSLILAPVRKLMKSSGRPIPFILARKVESMITSWVEGGFSKILATRVVGGFKKPGIVE